ncbi:MAG: superoxide dismutase, Fe-Mn family [Verrucomicrobiota bacterium]
MITRRKALQRTSLLTVAAAVFPATLRAAEAPAPAGPFQLAPLPYPADALEPHIDAQTMTIHHDRHHQTYVANLNKAIAGHPDLAAKSVEQIVRHVDEVPESIRTAVRNQGGGHYNHSLFWQMMKKGGGGQPTGPLAKAIDNQFTSFEKFKAEFTGTAMKIFGSGWAWLVVDDGKLDITSRPNQDNPLMNGKPAILGLDVWEHAYYLKYQNKRADYVAAFFNVINWEFVAAQYQKHRQ